MKTLYVLRHAKSSWGDGVEDHKRTLKTRGEEDAKLVSDYVKNKLQSPEKIFLSDATRTKKTAQYFKEIFQVSDKDFILNSDLYDFGGSKVIEVIKSLDNSLDRVMIVGHNHALTSIVNAIGDKDINNIPTCGFVEIQFDIESWEFVYRGKTTSVIFPRDLKSKEI